MQSNYIFRKLLTVNGWALPVDIYEIRFEVELPPVNVYRLAPWFDEETLERERGHDAAQQAKALWEQANSEPLPRQTRAYHICPPDCEIADGMGKKDSFRTKNTKQLIKSAYKALRLPRFPPGADKAPFERKHSSKLGVIRRITEDVKFSQGVKSTMFAPVSDLHASRTGRSVRNSVTPELFMPDDGAQHYTTDDHRILPQRINLKKIPFHPTIKHALRIRWAEYSDYESNDPYLVHTEGAHTPTTTHATPHDMTKQTGQRVRTRNHAIQSMLSTALVKKAWLDPDQRGKYLNGGVYGAYHPERINNHMPGYDVLFESYKQNHWPVNLKLRDLGRACALCFVWC